MLRSFCIKTNNNKIINDIIDELENSEVDNLYLTTKIFKNYKNVIMHYKGEDVLNFYALIAGILTNIVINYYESKYIKNFLISNYFYFSEPDRIEILKGCSQLRESSVKEKILRKNLIFTACFDYIKEKKSLILDGFIYFRLKQYMKELDEIVDLAVEKFVLDREYNEFTSLLKLYVNTRETVEDIVHLVYQSQESILLNKKMQTIDTTSNIFDAKYLSDISFSSNDYALNALLNLLPETLYIHLIDGDKDEFIETIEIIFDERVRICKDCEICNIYKTNNKDRHKIIIKE